jgi:hypothetical protein
MTTMPANYFSRFLPSKNYEEHLFVAGRELQSAELNDLQKQAAYGLGSLADALFLDGDVVRGATIAVNTSTGVVTCASGAVYLRGQVRNVASASLTGVAMTGTVGIGLRLVETVITALSDNALLGPASGQAAYGLRGAERLRVVPTWGTGSDADPSFIQVYELINGLIDYKYPPLYQTIFGSGVPVGAVVDIDGEDAPPGYVKANGMTIGNSASGATNRADADTRELFFHYWAQYDNTNKVIQDSAGLPTTRGLTAAADWAANKRMPVLEHRGEWRRGLDDGRGIDPSRALGSHQDGQNSSHSHTLTVDSSGSHEHAITVSSAGSHNHANDIFNRVFQAPYAGSLTGSDTNGSGAEQAIGAGDSAVMSDAGSHEHTATSSSSGAHTHAGSISSTGGTENRVRGVALLACIKL